MRTASRPPNWARPPLGCCSNLKKPSSTAEEAEDWEDTGMKSGPSLAGNVLANMEREVWELQRQFANRAETTFAVEFKG